MSLNVVAYPHVMACREAAAKLAHDAAARDVRPVLLVASYGQQLEMQKWLAAHGSGFGVTVTTLFSWVRELWEIFGNGSAVVGGEARMVALWRLLRESDDLPQTPGVLNLLNRCAMVAAPYLSEKNELSEREKAVVDLSERRPDKKVGLAAQERVGADLSERHSDEITGLAAQETVAIDPSRRHTAGVAELSAQERAVVELLGRYLEELHPRGYVEYSEALVALANDAARMRYAPVLVGVREDQLSFAQRAFLEAWDATLVLNRHSKPAAAERATELLDAQRLLFQRGRDDEPVRAGGALRMALAAGPSASKRIACRALAQALDLGYRDVVVASPQPIALFEFAMSELASWGDGSTADDAACRVPAERCVGCEPSTLANRDDRDTTESEARRLPAESRVTCSLSAKVKFRDTDMGRALIDLGQLVSADDLDDPLSAMPLEAADFAYSPFSSMGRVAAFKTDKVHRNDRLTGQGAILSDLAGNAHDSLQGLIGLLEAGDYQSALDLLQGYLDRRFGGNAAYYAQQRRALDAARRICEEGPDLPFGALMSMAASKNVVVNVSADAYGGVSAAEQDACSDVSHTERDVNGDVSAGEKTGDGLSPASMTASDPGDVDSVANSNEGVSPVGWSAYSCASSTGQDAYGDVGAGEMVRVRFMSQAEASLLEPGSVDCVILAGLDAAAFPVSEPESALTTLLAKLGVAVRPDPLTQARDTFSGAFEAAKHLVVAQRSLNDQDGNPAQAATVLEELLDCYRPDPQSDEGTNRTLGIPVALEPYTMQLGEQDVLGNAGAKRGGLQPPRRAQAGATADAASAGGTSVAAHETPSGASATERKAPLDTACAPQRKLRVFPQPQVGSIDDAARELIVLPFRYAEGTFDGVDVSPSQVESYLDCPYCWFAQRRLRLEGLDEGFSPLERGSFMHDVLRKFYLRFQAEVQPKVTTDALDEARRIMTETFDAVCAEQPFGRFGSRYVPRTAWERKEQQAVLPKLLDFLEMEAKLLPTFVPRAFEWQFATTRPMPYAGCNLRGCVDRIDVNERGQAVVIDYKSSLSNAYRLFDAKAKEQPTSFELPKRLQTLMYARIVREHFGYQMVGALYVNPLKLEVLGAYDAHAIGPADIPFARKTDVDCCKVPYPFAKTFDELLDTCEDAVAERLTHLQAGEIEPDPAHDEACEHCPVNVCPKRRVTRR